MDQFLLVLVAVLAVAAVVFGITVLITGSDVGLAPVEPDGRAVSLPGTRPLLEDDVSRVRFDTSVRGYRMAQVDQALRRTAYDIGYKDELIGVLEAEIVALREGRVDDADALRRTRLAALTPVTSAADADSADPTSSVPAGAAPPAGADPTPSAETDPTRSIGADPTRSVGADPTRSVGASADATDPVVAGIHHLSDAAAVAGPGDGAGRDGASARPADPAG